MASNSLRNNSQVAQDQGWSLDCIAYALARILNVLSRNTSLVYDDSVFDTALSILKVELNKFKAAKINKPFQLWLLEDTLHWSILPLKARQYIVSLQNKWKSNRPENMTITLAFVLEVIKRRSLYSMLPNDIGQYLEIVQYKLEDKTKVLAVLKERRRILFDYIGYPEIIECLHNEALGLTPIKASQLEERYRMLKSVEKVQARRRAHCVVLRSWEGGKLRFTDSHSPKRGHYGDFCIEEAVLELNKDVFNYFMYDIYLNEKLPLDLRENMKCEMKRPTLPVVEKGYFFQIRTSVLMLGSGSFGNVCRGRIFTTNQFNRSVAVKSLHWLSTKKVKRMQLKLFKYNHPNIVEIYGFTALWYFYNSIFIAMEEHIPLTHIFKSALKSWTSEDGGPLGYGWNYFIAHDIASGIEYLHKNHVCHGDVAMANVVVSIQGIAKLIDLESVSLEGTLDQSHQLFGHVGYQGGRSSDNHKLNVDTHNLGALIAHLVTGKPAVDVNSTHFPSLSNFIAGLKTITMEVIKIVPEDLTAAFASCGVERKTVEYMSRSGCTFIGKNNKGVVQYASCRESVTYTNEQCIKTTSLPIAPAKLSFFWLTAYFLPVLAILISLLANQMSSVSPGVSTVLELPPTIGEYPILNNSANIEESVVDLSPAQSSVDEIQEIYQFLLDYEFLKDTMNIQSKGLPRPLTTLLQDVATQAWNSTQQLVKDLDEGKQLRALERSIDIASEVYPAFIPYWCLPNSMTQSEYVFGRPINKTSVGVTVDENWVLLGVDFIHHLRKLLYQIQLDFFRCLAEYYTRNKLVQTGNRYLGTSSYNMNPVCFNPIIELHYVDELKQIELECPRNPRLPFLVENIRDSVESPRIYNKRTVMQLALSPLLSRLNSSVAQTGNSFINSVEVTETGESSVIEQPQSQEEHYLIKTQPTVDTQQDYGTEETLPKEEEQFELPVQTRSQKRKKQPGEARQRQVEKQKQKQREKHQQRKQQQKRQPKDWRLLRDEKSQKFDELKLRKFGSFDDGYADEDDYEQESW